MSNIYPSTAVYLGKSTSPDPKNEDFISGKGVFASCDIKKGEIIEVAPILILEFTDLIETRWNLLFEYYFWMDDYVVLALGFASLYNHSKDPNASYEIKRDDKTITFTAIKNIKKDEEIYFNYKGASNPKTPLWFEK